MHRDYQRLQAVLTLSSSERQAPLGQNDATSRGIGPTATPSITDTFLHAGSLVSVYQPNVGFATDSKTIAKPPINTAGTDSTSTFPQSLGIPQDASTPALASPLTSLATAADGSKVRRRRHKPTQYERKKKLRLREEAAAAAAEAGDEIEDQGPESA